MENGHPEFRTALEAFESPAGSLALARALGLRPALRRLGAEGLPGGVARDGAVPREAWSVAERAGLVLVLLVFERELAPAGLSDLCGWLARRDPTRHRLLIGCPSTFATVTFAVAGPDGEVRQLTFDRRRPLSTDLDTLAEMVAGESEGGLALLLRYSRALDRARVGARFFRDFRAQRERVALGWRGLPRAASADRPGLALLFLCRLLFLYFLQRLGHLAGRPDYLAGRWNAWLRARPGRFGFYRSELVPLFFGALNTRPADRSPEARALGALPYLNGGLFERTAAELAVPALDLPDPVVATVFEDLFEKYRFTTAEPAGGAAGAGPGPGATGIDPAMLGRVFEGLMAPAERGRTGTFFTPPRVVDALVGRTLDAWLRDRCGPEPGARLRALQRIRILDPACGSGAFLLGALAGIAERRAALGEDAASVRCHAVAHSLHGVDLQADAALLCALRLWLALTLPAGATAGEVAPLPNLDRRVRQGDALLDPFDLSFPEALPFPSASRRALRREVAGIAPLAQRYLGSEPGEREALKRELHEREACVARLWVDGWNRAADRARRALELRGAQRDLWGEPTTDALAARDALRRLDERARETDRAAAALRDAAEFPFFSFPIHFPESALEGFDVILMNPPWVRPHRWPVALRRLVRERYAVCREPAWSSPAQARGRSRGGQVDLSMLFLERAIGLLAQDGALGALLPAKMIRSLYAGPARRMLLQRTRIISIEDHGLDQRALFDADAFAMKVVALRRNDTTPTGHDQPITVVMQRPGRKPHRFQVREADLPLVRGDVASPWLLAPARARAALRKMQAGGTPLGRLLREPIRRGIETGANDVLVVREAEPRLGGLAAIRAEGAFRKRGPHREPGSARTADFEAVIEDRALQPLLRGADLRAWTFDIRRYLIGERDERGLPRESCPRLRDYLARHSRQRNGRRSARPHRVEHRVAWHDLAAGMTAVALPDLVPVAFGGPRPLHVLNTVYWLGAADADQALLLAALLNSNPVRAFAAAIAERAKDAHFRFFAWTVSLLPVPDSLRAGRAARPIVDLSRAAHADGAISEEGQERLDDAVARAFSLSPRERRALARFDGWLHGRAPA